ncbi:ammonium transporter [Propionibacteriaceae bacterium Y1923]|uniref:ammonium transporter n=1 Tax=Aestuariimicrobium sp. Y1814 TaxID=3418742 RepID=UPI003C1CECB9
MNILELNTGDTAWVLAAAGLVLLMTPGLALFYGGMVRAKSVLNMMMMSIIAMATVGVLWVLFGFSLAFGESWNGIIGDPTQFAGLQNTAGVLLGDEGNQIPLLVFVGFQAAFAIIATALASGAVADRMKFSAWVVFTIVWASLVYFPAAHWVFAFDGSVSETGGFIANTIGAIDFAGGTAIHINAGMAALMLAIVVGPRLGFGTKPMRPQNLTLVMLGAGLLWFGWFGFNAGSALGANELAGLTWVNTLVATGAAMLAWLVVERIRDGHATSLGAASGIVAGLVAITPACAAVTPLGAVAVGALAGLGCALAVKWKSKLGIDDSLDVVAVHLLGGLIGTLAVGLFAKGSLNDGVAGLFYGGGVDQLGRQALGAVAVMVYSGIVSLLIALAIKYTMGIRVTPAEEAAGIDLAAHAENGYDLSSVGYSSYRVRSTLVVPAAPAEPESPAASAVARAAESGPTQKETVS